jgi:hypothetical protein
MKPGEIMFHRSFRRWLPAILVSALAVAAGCGDDTPDTPTIPTPVLVTETFSGTITPNGAATHTFVSQRAGTVTATLTTVTPDETLVLGLGLGTWNGVVCQVTLANDQARKGSVITGTVSAIGNLCVRVFDNGNFTEPTSYEVVVQHP